jgi:bacterioferritin
MEKPILTDIKELGRRARSHMEEGAVTEGYRADRATVLQLINEALETELVCVPQYKRHERIAQLGGAPDMNPDNQLSRGHSEYVEGEDLVDMIREDLVAERIAVDS